jgi:hypothetical protein
MTRYPACLGTCDICGREDVYVDWIGYYSPFHGDVDLLACRTGCTDPDDDYGDALICMEEDCLEDLHTQSFRDEDGNELIK